MHKARLVIILLLAVLVGVVWYAVWQEEQGVLTIAFLDVGQGDATFIESPTGKQVLIDGGATRSVLRELGRVMPFYDRSIDVVIATHPDKDHIGGLPDVLNSYDVSFIFDPQITHDNDVYDAFVYLAEHEPGAHYLHAKRGQVLDLGGGAYLRILFPDRHIPEIESNAGSVIGQLVYGETEVLLTGDAPSSIERYVLSLHGESLASDILKAGHHGSDTSSDPGFVALVDPTYAVVSAGRDNPHGHPHQEVLDTFARHRVEVLGTYDEGTITFVSDGNRVWRQE